MSEFGPFASPEAVLIFILIAGAGVLSMMFALACHVRNEIQVHDLKVNVLRVQAAHLARMKELAEAGHSHTVKPSEGTTSSKTEGASKTSHSVQKRAA